MKFGHLEGVPQPYLGDENDHHGYESLTSHGMILQVFDKNGGGTYVEGRRRRRRRRRIGEVFFGPSDVVKVV